MPKRKPSEAKWDASRALRGPEFGVCGEAWSRCIAGILSLGQAEGWRVIRV